MRSARGAILLVTLLLIGVAYVLLVYPGLMSNRDPLATFTASLTSGPAPLTVQFDASASSGSNRINPTGDIVSYDWAFGDGDSGSGIKVVHTYSDNGMFTATLTVTDRKGATNTANTGISVGGPAKIFSTVDGTNKIQRAHLDGSGIEDLVTGLGHPTGIALDETAGKMYWTDKAAHKIQRANLDGSGVEDLVTGLSIPRGIALDPEGGKVYWTHLSRHITKIQRADLDGSGIEDVTVETGTPSGIALDPVGDKMYWTRFLGIQRANLDGSDVEVLVNGLTSPRGIALDPAGGKMYWTDIGAHKIQRANLNGSGVEDLVTELDLPMGIALDPVGGKMYWTDIGTHKIQRANLDGSGVEDIVTWGLGIPTAIALGN